MTKINSDLPHNLMGFVNDPVSKYIIETVIKESAIAYAEVEIGDTQNVIDFMKNHRSPKVLIVDLSASELPLSDIMKIKELSAPNINIIAIGTRNEVGLFRDLTSLGVSDYLAKPINSNILKNAINKTNNPANITLDKTGKMIYVISSVGGAGATTVTTNVSWILANVFFKRTVVVALDFLYGTTNLMLDLKTENSYLDILESPDKIDEYFIETILKKRDQRLYYLGGLVDLTRGVHVDIASFEVLLSLVKKQFNYILVDATRDVSSMYKSTMDKTDSFIIVVEMSIASAQNTSRMLEFLNTEQPGKKVVIISNKVGLSSNGALTKESFEKVIDRKIDYLMSLDEELALASANIGQPLAASGGLLSESLEDIAVDILGKKEDLELAKRLNEESNASQKIQDLLVQGFNLALKAFKK